jgi:HPt (histidine-containing phosphotransfer) domain-containing protein
MIDPQALEAHYGTLPGFALRLMGRTRDALPQQVQGLRQAMAQQDAKALIYNAHALHGVAANLLINELRLLAEQTEQLARAGDMAAACTLGECLAQAVEALYEALNQHLAAAGQA